MRTFDFRLPLLDYTSEDPGSKSARADVPPVTWVHSLTSFFSRISPIAVHPDGWVFSLCFSLQCVADAGSSFPDRESRLGIGHVYWPKPGSELMERDWACALEKTVLARILAGLVRDPKVSPARSPHIVSIHGIGLPAMALVWLLDNHLDHDATITTPVSHADVPRRFPPPPVYPLYGALGSPAAGMPSKQRYSLVPTGKVLAKGRGE